MCSRRHNEAWHSIHFRYLVNPVSNIIDRRANNRNPTGISIVSYEFSTVTIAFPTLRWNFLIIYLKDSVFDIRSNCCNRGVTKHSVPSIFVLTTRGLDFYFFKLLRFYIRSLYCSSILVSETGAKSRWIGKKCYLHFGQDKR